MKGKLLTFLVLPLFVFAFILISFPTQTVNAGNNGNISICHHNNGVKGFVMNTVDAASILSPGHGDHAQDIIPPFVFNANSHLEHRHCDIFFFVCIEWGEWTNGGKHGNALEKSYEQERTVYTCPAPSIVNTSDATKCNFPSKGNQSILSNSCVVPAEGTCPTVCGYAGGTVPDGDGGVKTCTKTNSCSTHRWCFPDRESETGYLAQAISVDITPPVGKPWESGKMINQYCAYTPAGTCPTECGYEGGDEVADGKGGTIVCEQTNSCSTHRWCTLQEDDSYLAQAISDNEKNPEGKPWVTGMDRYCVFPAAGVCPTECGYEGGDVVADGEGGTITCDRTAVCEQPEVCEYNSELTADDPECKAPVVMCQYDTSILASDPLCAPKDTDGEVKGVTDVVTADTAGGIESYAYMIQAALILITANLFVAFGKEYLKK